VAETPPLIINEFHYDDAGDDEGEFIEVAGAPDFDLTGWTLVLYNGVNGREYGTVALAGTTNALGLASVDVPGLQNGSPDGFALVAPDGSVAEFLSYEGSFTAQDGPAAGLTSLDVGVAEGPGTSAGLSLQRQPDETWVAGGIATRDAPNDSGGAFDVAQDLIVNEFHYDNVGGDTGQFIEVRGEPGASLPGWTIVLYNGDDGTVYDETRLTGRLNDDGVADFDISGFQNGSPDGIALVGPRGEVREFISYEGTFTATDGPAAGMVSTDIGVSEPNDTPIGQSLQRLEDGTWVGPIESTRGEANEVVPDVAETLEVSEIHYDNAGADTGEFIEVAGAAGASVEGWSLVLYNGNGGAPYRTIALDGTLNDDGVASVDAEGLQNGAPDGIALVRPDGSVAEFLSYEGAFTAIGGPADGMMSTDIGVSEGSGTPVGQSLQKLSDGTWIGPVDATRDAANGDGGGGGGPAEFVLISEVQGSGAASDRVGQNVAVEAVVTATASNGFYLQEEDADADADAATSEGVFVFTGGAPTVTVGEIVFAEGEVSEFFDLTQITADLIEVRGMADLPTAAGLTLPFTMETDLEALEGMLVTVTSTGEPLTIIENFNFDRFGELVVSAGVQLQPTQIFDAQTEAADVAALQAANLLNRLAIDDGVSAQNPDSFGYIANTTAGDDGDGILSAGDDFTMGNPAPRLGAEIIEPIEGVLTFSFGEYKVVPTGTLDIDPATNDGAREATPPAVEGDLKVVSFNALNYFTTLGERGATTADDLARQTEKLVNALVALDGDVVGLQEIENNGFGPDGAVATLVDALNARLGSEVYAFVDPTDDGGAIGTDAITTGLIYKVGSVTEIASDFLVFDDGAQQLNRPAVVAAFEDENGGVVTIANNHFKSKGPSGVEAGDPNADQGDGQGNWNVARTEAAQQLTDWLATDPLGVGDPDVLIIGDLNAYSQEDPVQAIEAAGYDNLLEEFVGAADAFSFVFDGQRGALDHAMATESLDGQVKGVVEWHVNSPEPDLMSYDSERTDPGFYDGTTPFGASDHDPLIVGLTLTPSEPEVIG
ncbi:MAG: ExeM/NucH family extracellular endonuclease, partial [Pseudomonadota bacterium]